MILIDINTPPKDEHDLGYKSLFSKKKSFMHFLSKYIGAEWVNEINEDDLVLMNNTFILKDYKDKESDIIYRLKMKGIEIIFYVLLELQSKVDFTILYRLHQYISELYRRIFDNTDKNERQSKNFKLPVVTPIILYNGVERWSVARSFKEYLNGYELFGKNVIDFEYLLLDLNRSNKEFILSTNTILDNIFALDQKNEIKEMIRSIIIVLGRMHEMEKDEQVELLRWLEHIMIPRLPIKDREKIRESIRKGGDEMLQYNLDRAFDDERKKGRREGKKEGIQEGKKKREKEIAEKFLKMGLTVDQVMEGTELPEEEVIKIKTQLNYKS
ncbi:MAG: Rpn family recombination-promoting nuclease/putative transposase [Oscillospiraceae bacterium]|nr:Rpn family recombination-promoting nuclease/putative transposase [Oscillospiraceae bacterium]